MCENMVKQWMVNGDGEYSEFELPCGDTGKNGKRLMCDECLAKANEQYPQGWRHVPGDVCTHGMYVGDPYGPDYICGYCEEGL